MADLTPTKQEHLFKILVIGDLGVGKTSLIKRFVHDFFSTNYKATIGVDFALKVLKRPDRTVRLQLWDIGGQEKFSQMTSAYFKSIAFFLLLLQFFLKSRFLRLNIITKKGFYSTEKGLSIKLTSAVNCQRQI